MWKYSRWKNSYDLRQYDYNLIDDVYKNIKKNSRVIFIVRHAERWTNDWKLWGLIQNGINQSKALWKRLSWWNFKNTDTDLYLATPYKRTPETSFYVWYGRGHKPFLNDEKIFTNNRKKYSKIKKTIDVIDPDYITFNISFEKLNKKSVHMTNKLCKLTEWHPFCFITSHDNLVIPLITWISEWIIKFTWKTRVNYLSWIVIIINETTKQWEWYPIRTFRKKSMVLDNPENFQGLRCSQSKKFQK